ncbi:MAG: ABC transporter ATP-binding protein [Actinobacteria bacterium]|jgi:branched-chain amino acid transport system ATP-binding protein|nr:ABC transporter ATP-binding protein [Actinomycetota bacterium]NBP91309.1 ABC transporter ATP-binding protein [Actinomycetota bacterium]
MLLEIKDLTVAYGGAKALDNLHIGIEEGEFVVLLGANGAGKTTTLRSISGLLKPASGEIIFEGRDLVKTQSFRRSELGIAHVPEGRQIFPDHTVAENLQLGGFTVRRDVAKVNSAIDEVFQLFPRLAERREQKAGTLSGGEAQMLAVGRALMGQPRLLMLDEPSLGLAPRLVIEMFGYLKRLHKEKGLTILLVEQQARLALQISQRGYVLERGVVAISGTSESLKDDPAVVAAYLGHAG